jgi:hypothetical protein
MCSKRQARAFAAAGNALPVICTVAVRACTDFYNPCLFERLECR